MKPRLATFVILPFGVLIAGCNVAPIYLKPQPDLGTRFKTSGPWRVATPRDQTERGSWWELFGDSRLSRLMKEAEQGNSSLEIAFHRLNEARALARADRAGLFPFLSLNASAERSRGGNRSNQGGTSGGGGSAPRNTFRATLDLDYELDLWGRVRNQMAAGRARTNAAEANYFSALLSLQGELAANYFALRAQDAEIALLRRTVQLRRKTLQLARTRFEEGDIGQIDVAQAETDLAETESTGIGLEKRRAELEHAIALLLGKTPSQFSLPPIQLEGAPPSVPASVPSDLLERRPDIAAAEREMAAANAEIGVARAALFPSVTIGLTGGAQSSVIEKLTSSASRVWGLGPAAIDLPIFEGGKRRANVVAAEARYNQAAATYRETVLKAVRDVEDALSGISILRRQSAAQEATVASARRALDLSQKRYDSGLVAYYEVLDAQRTLLQAEQEAERIQRERFLAAVQLIKALGGGW